VPEFRGGGTGPLLLREYLNLLKQKSTVNLLEFECMVVNDRAMAMYVRSGVSVGHDLVAYSFDDIKPDGDADLSLKVEDKMDLTLPWLAYRTSYSWQRQIVSSLNSSQQQCVFERNGKLALALMVEEKGDKLRLNQFAYSERPSSELFTKALQVLAHRLGKTNFEVANEPGYSDITEVLSNVGNRRRDLSQKYMSISIDRN
jgi:hypothetical protein